MKVLFQIPSADAGLLDQHLETTEADLLALHDELERQSAMVRRKLAALAQIRSALNTSKTAELARERVAGAPLRAVETDDSVPCQSELHSGG